MHDLNISLSVISKHKMGKLYKLPPEINNIKHLSHDSRKITADCWFICLKGNHSDGHAYIQAVLEQGVQYIIYEPLSTHLRPAGIQVADTNLFLAQLASWWRKHMQTKVIAVTGSNGKTSTKELLYFLLSKIFFTHKRSITKSPASFNNHFGLPFTLLNITQQTAFAVVEMGTNHPGEIRNLSKWSMPDYALITSIQKVHIGHFKDIEAIADEKSDILYGMKEVGHLVYPENIAFRSLIIKKAKQKNINVNEISENKLEISNVVYQEGGTFFEYNYKQYFLPLQGKHQFKNFVLVVGFLELLQKEKKISQDNILGALSELHTFKNASGRMEMFTKEKITICNDSYNANPSSFRAAIISLSEKFPRDQLMGAFGYMAELGSHEIEEHKILAKLAAEHLKVVSFFSTTTKLNEAFRAEWLQTRTDDEIFIDMNEDNNFSESADFLQKFIKKGDCILIKGSRLAQMEKILKKL